MKPIFLLCIAILFCGCKYQAGNPQARITQDTTLLKKDTISNANAEDEENDDSEDDRDSVQITFNDLRDTLIYSKNEFAKIEANYLGLTGMYPENPDEAFAQTTAERKLARKEGVNGLPTFSSEVGIDEYYMLYAYFLKKRNGERRYRQETKNAKGDI